MPTSQTVNPLFQLVPFVAIFAIFYFLIMRPQKKQEQAHRKMLAELGKNDEVITASGIHGTIVSAKEKTFILRVDENVKIEIEKSSVAVVKNKDSARAQQGVAA